MLKLITLLSLTTGTAGITTFASSNNSNKNLSYSTSEIKNEKENIISDSKNLEEVSSKLSEVTKDLKDNDKKLLNKFEFTFKLFNSFF
ncbi:hypothetical protein MSUIS_06400 [Mycoplasma suis KI3806]|uniref:Uncharacterized protein n=1 Tax=Mycoplasma suis (strain KI_3806) TaxID=708248 RepID=F0V252_MYCS3|nr:hypothetical protein MSUIS_06400 [Mycoplasma suis KI3806]